MSEQSEVCSDNYKRNQILSTLSIEKICELLKGTSFEPLNKNHSENFWEEVNFDKNNKDEITALHELYTDLSELKNTTLYDLYDTYMQDCEHIGGWGTPDRRTNLFVYYVLGKNSNYKLNGQDALELGKNIITELLIEDEKDEKLF